MSIILSYGKKVNLLVKNGVDAYFYKTPQKDEEMEHVKRTQHGLMCDPFYDEQQKERENEWEMVEEEEMEEFYRDKY